MPASQKGRQFERTVERLLDAAFDDAGWGDAFMAMDRLCNLNGGQLTAMAENADGNLGVSFGACYINGDSHQEIVADWSENYSAYSENVPRIGKLPTWHLTHNEELFTAAEKRLSVMYNEFQPKYDCRDQVAVVVDRPSGERRQDYLMWTMANAERGWEPGKLNRIRGLLPHIRQAVRVRHELVRAEANTYADLSPLLEGTTLGVILLDRRGVVTFANQPASLLLRVGKGVYEWQGALRARLPRDDARLRSLIG